MRLRRKIYVIVFDIEAKQKNNKSRQREKKKSCRTRWKFYPWSVMRRRTETNRTRIKSKPKRSNTPRICNTPIKYTNNHHPCQPSVPRSKHHFEKHLSKPKSPRSHEATAIKLPHLLESKDHDQHPFLQSLKPVFFFFTASNQKMAAEIFLLLGLVCVDACVKWRLTNEKKVEI